MSLTEVQFRIYPLMPTRIYFDASRREEQDGVQIMSLVLFGRKLFFCQKKRYFDPF